jgi:hypothetical protein
MHRGLGDSGSARVPTTGYQFKFNKLNDYPKLGVWSDGYYMTMNQFTSISLQWAGQGVVAFDRARMLAGQPASAIYFDLAPVDINLGGMLPADADGPAPPAGSPEYFVQVDDDAWGDVAADQLSSGSFMRLAGSVAIVIHPRRRRCRRRRSTRTCAARAELHPQPGTTARVDAIADRLMYRLQYRNFGTYETLVVNHTVDVDATDHAGIPLVRSPQPGLIAVHLPARAHTRLMATIGGWAARRWTAPATLRSGSASPVR